MPKTLPLSERIFRPSGAFVWAICINVFVILAGHWSGAVEPELDSTSRPATLSVNEARSFISDHCKACHNASESSGDLNLEAFDGGSPTTKGDTWDSSSWEKILKRLRSRQMPPIDSFESVGVARPSDENYVKAIQFFENSLDIHGERYPNPGRPPTLRRLNRTEYQNAIRDLLALEIEADQLLPPDQSSLGFDNITVVELSPTLLSRYLAAAEHISRLAVGGKQKTPSGTNVRLPADQTQESHVEGLPLGTRGGALLRHHFPQTGVYEVQVRLARDRDEKIEGLSGQHDIDVILDKRLVERLTVYPPKIKDDYTLLDSNLKSRFHVDAGLHSLGVTFPKKHSSLMEIKRQPFDASYNRHRHPRRSPAIFEIAIVGPFESQGPGETPSRQILFGELDSGITNRATAQTKNDSKESNDYFSQARRILTNIVRHAYRRKVKEADLETPMAFYAKTFESQGMNRTAFESGIQTALASVLVNPNFLFRIESEPKKPESDVAASSDVQQSMPSRFYQIDDFELATRLSFFLWSSIPDEELLQLAEQNRLHDSVNLRSQVKRMLKDSKSKSLIENFASQWLYLRNLDSIHPDLRLFPDFDDNLRQAFRMETQLLFEEIVKEDRDVLELLQANYTFLNDRLAKHYGIANINGSHFRKVTLDPKDHRGGLLRHGSILTVTSYATRTSPTIRGNWILQNILGTPPPPPPPNVPALKEKSQTEFLSVRERLSEHRANVACASCHNLMDPIGFALENYDAVGRWRQHEGELPIDVSGSLPDGSKIAGVEDLNLAIMKRPEEFVGTLVEKLMTFALGRGMTPADGPAIRKVIRQASQVNENDTEYRFPEIIAGIVNSQPFQMRLFESEIQTP